MATAVFDFTGSVVLVTGGGGSAIGRSIVGAFLDAGATVAVSGRRSDKLAEVLSGRPADTSAGFAADLTDPAAVRGLVDDVVARFGRLDVVVSNAAAYEAGDVTELDDDAWAAMRATNVDAFFHLAKAALPHLERSGGSLVAISSVSVLRGDWGQAAYNATKAAVTNFVRSLALDWGGRGVRLNAVAPSLTATDLTAGMLADGAVVAAFTNRTALGKVGQPEDTSPAVLFLASESARNITGAVLAVDGGVTASTGQPHLG